jgi:hypothetical protein
MVLLELGLGVSCPIGLGVAAGSDSASPIEFA